MATKKKTPLKPKAKPKPAPPKSIVVIPPVYDPLPELKSLRDDLTAAIGDGGSVETRQATIDRLGVIISDLEKPTE